MWKSDRSKQRYWRSLVAISIRLINGAVMLSEAKYLWPVPVGGSAKIDLRFFASLRMTI